MSITIKKQDEMNLKQIGHAFNRESLLIVYGNLKLLQKDKKYGEKYRAMKDADFEALRKTKIHEEAELLSRHNPEIDAALKKYEKKNKKDADAVNYNILLALDNKRVRKEIDRVSDQYDDAKGTFKLDVHYHPVKTTLGIAAFIGTGGLALLAACGGETPQQMPVPMPTQEDAGSIPDLSPPIDMSSFKQITRNIGPVGGRVEHVAIDPYNTNHLLAASYEGGIFESNDGGTHWNFSSMGMNDLRMASVAFDQNTPGVAYALTGAGLLKRVGNGNWTIINAQLSATGRDEPFIFMPNGVDALVVTQSNIGYSSDGGKTWSISPNPAGFVGPGPFLKIGASFTNQSIYLATANGVYRSDDKTKSWKKLNLPVQDYEAVDVSNDGTVYLGTASGTAMKFDGVSWKNLPNPGPNEGIRSILVNPTKADEVYVGGAYGVYHSTDGGSSWHEIFQENNKNSSGYGDDIRSMTPDWKNNLLYVSSDQGVYTFNTATKFFTNKIDGLTNILAYGMSIGKSGTIYLGTVDTGTFTYDGKQWANHDFGDTALVIESKNALYYWNRFMSSIWRSKSGDPASVEYFGTFKFKSNPDDLGRMSMTYDNKGNLYIASGNGISKTNNEGASFSSLSQIPTNKLFFDETGRKLYATSTSEMPFFQELSLYSIDIDTGQTSQIKTFNSSINSFAVSGDNILVATNDGVYVSDNSGSTWQKINLPMDGRKIVSINPKSHNQYLVAYSSDFPLYGPIQGHGVFYSNDSGKSWQPLPNIEEVKNNPITSIVFDPNIPSKVYVSTYSRGVFEFNIPNK